MVSKLITFLTIDEVQKLIRAEKRKKYKLAIALGFGSGLRISEIIGGIRSDGSTIPPLTSDKVDLQSHQIRIMQGKGKKDRITVTSPWLNKTNIDLLPLNIPTRTLQDNFNKLTERVLGRRCNFHMLRHGFGNHMHVVKGVALTIVQLMMGHAKVDTTAIYARANPAQAIKEAWDAF